MLLSLHSYFANLEFIAYVQGSQRKNVEHYITEDLSNFLCHNLQEVECSGTGMLSVQLEGQKVTIQFASSEKCREAEYLHGTKCCGNILAMKVFPGVTRTEPIDPVPEHSPPPKTMCTSRDVGHHLSSECLHEEADIQPDILAVESTEAVPESKELARLANAKAGISSNITTMSKWDDAATAQLIQELYIRRSSFAGKSEMPPNTWRDISNALWLKNFSHSAISCRKRKKSLDSFFEKAVKNNGFYGKQQWCFYNAMMKLNGNKASLVLPQSQFDAGEVADVETEPTQFGAGEVAGVETEPTTNSPDEDDTLILINLYAERKYRFDNPQVPGNCRDELYKELANALAVDTDGRIILTGVELEIRMKDLIRQYPTYFDLTLTSGSGGIRWKYYDFMNDIFGKDVNMTPAVYASVGTNICYQKAPSQDGDVILHNEKENGSAEPVGHPQPQDRTPVKNASSGSKKRLFRSPLAELNEKKVQEQEDLLVQFKAIRAEMALRTTLSTRALDRRT